MTPRAPAPEAKRPPLIERPPLIAPSRVLEEVGASALTYLRLGLAFGLAASVGGLVNGRRRRGRTPVGKSAAAERAERAERQSRWLGELVEQAGEAAIALSPRGKFPSRDELTTLTTVNTKPATIAAPTWLTSSTSANPTISSATSCS